ncbi:MAG: Gfo/Idh/MocA family oxidoreductase [Phycisphaerae bacterium]|nr:Gfo/Idh/MocA family oxidoreductase [Phycisphaerae bacterium]
MAFRKQALSRRSFLKHSTLALAAPYVISSRALGLAGATAPSERIAVGQIGVGNIGSSHLHALLGHGDVQIVAICDVHSEKRQAAKQKIDEHYGAQQTDGKYAGCDVYNEFERLLERPDIDAVVIGVPDHWHATIAIAACRAGKDVYCEKPLSLTVREAEEMVRAARRYGTVFQTGSQQRSSPEFRKACELVRSGRIGEIKHVRANVGETSNPLVFPEQPIPDGFDYNRWLGPAPYEPYNEQRCSGDYGGGWRKIRDYSGGFTTDWGAHHFDIAQWGLGMDGSGPVEIIPGTTPDAPPITFRYANGVELYRKQEGRGILFTGTAGSIEVDRGYFRSWPDSIGETPLGPNDVHLYESPGHHQDWLNCIRKRRRPVCDVAIGASSVTVCHLGNIATWLGRALRWDPAKHEIIGDAEAARLLDRPKRAPWHL